MHCSNLLPVSEDIINSKLHEIMKERGRRKEPIWEYFYKLSVDGKIVAKCKNCGNIQSNKAA